jgi:hypothetical protein
MIISQVYRFRETLHPRRWYCGENKVSYVEDSMIVGVSSNIEDTVRSDSDIARQDTCESSGGVLHM